MIRMPKLPQIYLTKKPQLIKRNSSQVQKKIKKKNRKLLLLRKKRKRVIINKILSKIKLKRAKKRSQ
jgi:hypothetical protein